MLLRKLLASALLITGYLHLTEALIAIDQPRPAELASTLIALTLSCAVCALIPFRWQPATIRSP